MRTQNNSHKSVFLFEFCLVYVLAFKATEVLYTVNRNLNGRTFDHWVENGQSNFYATYQTSQGQRIGYFNLSGNKVLPVWDYPHLQGTINCLIIMKEYILLKFNPNIYLITTYHLNCELFHLLEWLLVVYVPIEGWM